jgi:hypothetical protein
MSDEVVLEIALGGRGQGLAAVLEPGQEPDGGDDGGAPVLDAGGREHTGPRHLSVNMRSYPLECHTCEAN